MGHNSIRMGSTTISLILFFSLNLLFINLTEAKHGKNLPSAVVEGTVYCDTCFQQDSLKASNFISGASVAVRCTDANLKRIFYKEVKTNEQGVFEAHLPAAVSKHVKNIQGCSVQLINSNQPSCAVASSSTPSSISLKGRKEGKYIFSAGFFTFKPLKQPEFCNEKLTAPTLPTLPTVPTLPTLPTLPTPLPTLPVPPTTGLPGLPGLPGVPKLPVPPTTGLPGLPGVPQLPVPELPVPLPELPPTTGLPGVPKLPVPLPELPPTTGLPGVPKLPVPIPELPPTTGLPGVPKLPVPIPELPPTTGLPAVPKLPVPIPQLPPTGLPIPLPPTALSAEKTSP